MKILTFNLLLVLVTFFTFSTFESANSMPEITHQTNVNTFETNAYYLGIVTETYKVTVKMNTDSTGRYFTIIKFEDADCNIVVTKNLNKNQYTHKFEKDDFTYYLNLNL